VVSSGGFARIAEFDSGLICFRKLPKQFFGVQHPSCSIWLSDLEGSFSGSHVDLTEAVWFLSSLLLFYILILYWNNQNKCDPSGYPLN
jgi:hypothetical protein